MKIKNTKEIDEFLFDHKENGCIGIKNNIFDNDGLHYNIAWQDCKTGEKIEIIYEGEDDNDLL